MRKTMIAVALLSVLGIALPVAADNEDAGASMRFQARLIGGDLNGNIIATNATGEAKLSVVDDGTAVRLNGRVQGSRRLWQAHTHIAPTGPVAPNQPVGPIAFFFVPTIPGAPNSNVSQVVNGEISGGFVMTDAQLVGPLTFDSNNAANTGVAGLIKAIQEARATIVVHTSDLNNANNQTP